MHLIVGGLGRMVVRFSGLILFVGISVVSLYSQSEKDDSYGLFFDNSGSMFTQLDRQRELGRAVLAKIPEKARVSIFGMATVPNASSPQLALASGARCSRDRTLLSNQIGTIQVARPGQTILIDALLTSGSRLSENFSGCASEAKRILVVFTDGEDRASASTADSLVAELAKLKVQVYVVALLESLSDDVGFVSKSPKSKSKAFLTRLAKETDGRIIFPKKKSSAEEIVSELFAENYSHPKK